MSVENYIPSNRQINDTLDSAEHALEDTKTDEKERLNKTGRQIIDQAEKLIFDARRVVNEKNRSDLMQQIIHEGSEVYKDINANREQWKQLQGTLNDLDSEALVRKMQNLSTVAKLVAIELISSGRFRQTVYDLFAVLYSILVDASHVGQVGRPLREALSEAASVTERPAREAIPAAGEKLQEAGANALSIGLDLADPGKSAVQLTDDQKAVLIEKLRDVLREIASRERTQRIVRGLFEIIDLIARPVNEAADKAAAATESVTEDRHVNRMLSLTQKLFEAFTRAPLDPLINQLKVLYGSMVEDEQVRVYVHDLRAFLFEVLATPANLAREDSKERISGLIDRGRALVQEKKALKENLEQIRKEVNTMIYAMENDPLTFAIQQDIRNLVEMVLLDGNGNITFKPEVLEQLKIIALSALVKRLKFPLPPLTFDDGESLRFTVTGLVLGIQDLLPERIIAENHGIAIIDMKHVDDPNITKAAEAIKIKMEHINVHMPESDIWFHRRTFPEVQDSGKAHIDIGGQGMDLIFVLKAAMASDRLFVLEKVECHIHNLELKLEQTHHDRLYNSLIVVFKGFIKRSIEDAIQESVANMFEGLTDQIQSQVAGLRVKAKELPNVLKSSQN
eukprot:TRINITY_DN5950_c0_g1_i1.p1 TRINITY_DN5950_c0_g1~~TRINITY_DN5950_c0_g1_i1.p1  ORF type:complete len:622 (+),score=168.91 TRINITY_DN5950_c0_g1_i1:36-1901(+)